MQPRPEWRRVSMAFERQQSAAASLTLSCPGLSAPAFQTQLDNTDCSPAFNWPLSRLGTGPATEGTEPRPDATHIQHPTSKGATRGQGQRPSWPLISRHVWTRPHTMRGPRQLIRIWRGWKRARGLRTVAGSRLCVHTCVWVHVCCWHGDLVSDCRTTGPSLKPPALPQMCSSCPRSLCWRPGGGITPGMIPYYWAGLPFRLGLVLLAGSGLTLLPVLPPLSWSLWCPHTLTTTSQQLTFGPF